MSFAALHTLRTLRIFCAAAAVLALAGCGGAGRMTAPPISVFLVESKVFVMPKGMPVIVQIAIQSTSETALVAFTGLPAGVEVKYSASDTSPSGILTFTAGATEQLGTFMPTVTVNSAGQTASTSFTLVVEK